MLVQPLPSGDTSASISHSQHEPHTVYWQIQKHRCKHTHTHTHTSTHACMCLCISSPFFCPLRAPTSNKTSIGMSTPHAQILVSKYHYLLKGTEPFWRNGSFQSRTKQGTRWAQSMSHWKVRKCSKNNGIQGRGSHWQNMGKFEHQNQWWYQQITAHWIK